MQKYDSEEGMIRQLWIDAYVEVDFSVKTGTVRQRLLKNRVINLLLRLAFAIFVANYVLTKL